MTEPPSPEPSYPQRGEVYWLNFSPATGAEMRDPHPGLIIQNNVGNQASALTVVAAITTNLRVVDLPVGVRIEPEDSGLPVPSAVHLGHIYTIDQRRLGRRVGQLPSSVLAQIDDAIRASLGLRPFRL